MSFIDYILILLVAVALVLVIARRVRRVKKGTFCDCDACSGDCAACRKRLQEQEDPKKQ